MKNTFLYITLILGCFQLCIAQQDVQRAHNYFKKEHYADAIVLYEAALPTNKNSSLIKNLADSYYHTFNLRAAARWYKYLINNYKTGLEEDYYFKLNHSLKAIGKYKEAEKILYDYYTDLEDEAKLIKLKANSKYLKNVKAIGARYKITNSNFNTTTSEFGAMQVGSQIWYTATHKKQNAKTYRWNNQNYLDIYTHPLNKKELGDSLSIELSKNINTKLHEGSFAISSDGKTIFFTRNNFINGKRKTDDKKVSNLKIYSANFIDGEWKNITELPFNSNDFSNEHPTLSSDGTKLYFASDRPGGYGSFDIYEVTIQPNNTYNSPINLGNTINTDKKEQFPFIAEDNSLYFSSNGHPSFGLLDIFISKNINGNFQKPDNLGLPVNSSYDDFSYSLNKDSKTGYFASNRPSGKGSDDIYEFTVTKELIIEDCKQFITGIITDRTTKKIIPEVNISLLDTDKNVIITTKSDKNGAFNFNVVCSTSYIVTANKDSYEGNSKNVITNESRNATHDASMDLFSFYEKEKAALIILKKKQEEEKIKAEILQEKKLKEEKAAAKLVLKEKEEELKRIEKEKLAENVKAKNALTEKIKNALQNENALVKDKERTIIKTQEIHFDYSLWYLRRETRERLQTVIQVMENNPSIIIEIGTHTDVRGNDDYNKDLSQKRADSVKDFLIKNGIASGRIISKGYGESQPIVICPIEDDCLEEDHEWNRRCEFVVVGWDYVEKEVSKK